MALNLFVALIHVAPSQIVAIIDSPDVGACPTMAHYNEPVRVRP
jgi:hypothetical protein